MNDDVFRTGEILAPGEEAKVVDVTDHVLTDRDRLAHKIVDRRDQLTNRRKMSKALRLRDPRRNAPTHANANATDHADGRPSDDHRPIRHATTIHTNEIEHPHLDDGSHEFLSFSLGGGDDDSNYEEDKYITFPSYFDSRVAWGRHCWYPVRNQGSCGSCYIVGLSDVVTNRACIAVTYDSNDRMGMLKYGSAAGKVEARVKEGIDLSSSDMTIPALSPQAIMSCLAEEINTFDNPQLVMGKAPITAGGGGGNMSNSDFSPCDGGNMVRVANYASRAGFVAEGSCQDDDSVCSEAACRCAPSSHAGSMCPGLSSSSYACVPYCIKYSKNETTRRTCPILAEARRGEGGTVPRAAEDKRVVTSLAFHTASQNTFKPDGRDSNRDLGTDTMLFPQVTGISRGNVATIVENVKHIKAELMRRGPIVATLLFNVAINRMVRSTPEFKFDLHPYDFRHFKDYTPKREDIENHTIKVIGWARIKNVRGRPQDVWIIQNSWGNDWGGSCRLDNPSLELYETDQHDGSYIVPPDERPVYPLNHHRMAERGYFFFPMADLDFVSGFNGTFSSVNSVETRAIAPIPQGIRVMSGDKCTVVTPGDDIQSTTDQPQATKYAAGSNQDLSPKRVMWLIIIAAFIVLLIAGGAAAVVIANMRRGGELHQGQSRN